MNSAAPTSSTSASPISVTTSSARALFCRNPLPDRPLLSLIVVFRSIARRLQRRNQAEDEAGGERDDRGERQHAPVDADAGPVDADARNVAGVDGQQRADADHADHQPEHAAHRRQHDALGQQLPHDAAAAGADRGADRDLALADGRAHQQQVGDVGARDQQDEGDRAQQHPQRRSDVADDDLLHRRDAEAALAAQRVRKRLAELLRGLLQLRGGGGERDARFQAAGGQEEMALHHAVRIDLKRQPDIRRARRRLDGFGIERAQHADHFVRLAVERQLAADDRRVAAEAALPEPFAQDDDVAAVRQVFRRRQRSGPATTGAPNSRKKSALTWAVAICSGSPSVRLTTLNRYADTS